MFELRAVRLSVNQSVSENKVRPYEDGPEQASKLKAMQLNEGSLCISWGNRDADRDLVLKSLIPDKGM